VEPLLARLQTYIQNSFVELESPRITDLVNLNSGWESEVYAFQLEYGPREARQQVGRILRIYPGGFSFEKSKGEYEALSNLHQMGYPVPEVYCLEAGGSLLSQPFLIMEEIDGQLLWPLMFRGTPDQQAAWLKLFCSLFVRLHTLDWELYVPAEAEKLGDPYQYATRMVDDALGMLKSFDLPDWLPMIAWLKERLPQVPCTQPAVVHGDFHPNNILIRDDNSAVVIDWTGAAISDPRFDLAWTLLLIECYEGPEWRARVLAEYERQWGEPLEGMEFFDAYACARRLFSVAVSIQAGAGALGMRPGAEQIMKSQIEPLRCAAARLRALTGLSLVDVDKLCEGCPQ
jgi:aminoglycoside phosphotransferase (APT) family kinase protein